MSGVADKGVPVSRKRLSGAGVRIVDDVADRSPLMPIWRPQEMHPARFVAISVGGFA